MRSAFVLVLSLCAFAQQPTVQPPAVARPATPHAYQGLDATAWVQTSAEYRAGAIQAYHAATEALDRARKDKRWSAALEQKADFKRLPPAVVLDLDETIFDNSGFQADSVLRGLPYSEDRWQKEWVDKDRAQLVPGALAFLQVVVTKKITPIYITNRVCDIADPHDGTLRSLRRLGVPLADPANQLLCKRVADEPSDKGPRRAVLATRFRILLLIGDDLNDFLSITKPQQEPAARYEIVAANHRFWGERWFIIANPMYGSWDGALGYTVAKKIAALRP
jgi:5'-nucleotidase (lipoprotein e(P4) family)